MRTLKTSDGYDVLVDDDIYERITHRTWRTIKPKTVRYAITNVVGEGERYLHRFIMGFPKCQVDHKNGNGLDNRRDNLRLASNLQNSRNSVIRKNNTTGYKGVSRNGSGWIARIQVSGVTICLGTFDSPKKAAIRYDIAAIKHFGEFARTNGNMGFFRFE